MDIDVRDEFDGRIRVLVFNRPAKKNALTLEMYTRLTEELLGAAASSRLRALVLTGAGDAFTTGNDIGDFVASPPTGEDSPVLRFLAALVRFPKPILAAVGGAAVGVGATMLLHCDRVVASASAWFQLPFTKLGLTAEGGSSFLLPRLAGMAQASEFLLWGEPFDAPSARRLGIVNEIVSDGEAQAAAMRYAQQVSELPPEAVAATKALLRAPVIDALEQCMRREANAFRERLASPEAAEAFASFFAKKKTRSDASSFDPSER